MQKNYVQEILSIIHSGLPKAELAEKLSDYHEKDLADALEALTPAERQSLYSILGVDTVAEIFTYLDDAEPYLKELPSHEAAKVISNMDSDDAVDALEDLDDTDKNEIVNKLDKDSVEDVKMLLSYDEDEIGSRMTTNYISIKNDMTIRQAMSELVKQAGENDNISTLYVVDKNEHFYGAIDLKDLIIARAEESLESLIVRSYPYVTDREQVSDCIDRIVDYAERSLPVLNDAGKLVGIITSSDVVELVDHHALLVELDAVVELAAELFARDHRAVHHVDLRVQLEHGPRKVGDGRTAPAHVQVLQGVDDKVRRELGHRAEHVLLDLLRASALAQDLRAAQQQVRRARGELLGVHDVDARRVVPRLPQAVPREQRVLEGRGELGGQPRVDDFVIAGLKGLHKGGLELRHADGGGLGELLVLLRVGEELLLRHVHAVQMVYAPEHHVQRQRRDVQRLPPLLGQVAGRIRQDLGAHRIPPFLWISLGVRSLYALSGRLAREGERGARQNVRNLSCRKQGAREAPALYPRAGFGILRAKERR